MKKSFEVHEKGKREKNQVADLEKEASFVIQHCWHIRAGKMPPKFLSTKHIEEI